MAAFFRRIDEHCTLRQLNLDDTEELFSTTDANRDHLRQWLPWVDAVQSPADTRAFIQSSLDQAARNDGIQCAIRVGDGIAGVIGYLWVNWPNRTTHIGYWLDAGHQGRGIMTKACQVMVDHAFAELELNRVEIAAAPGNVRSCAIPERLGFAAEGVRREAEWLYDHFVDNRCYAQLRSEWAAGRKR